MGNIRGGRGFWRWGGLRPLPPLLITKVIFSTFGKTEQFNGKMEQFGNEVEKMRMVVKTHNSIFSPFYLVISKVFSIFATAITKNQFI